MRTALAVRSWLTALFTADPWTDVYALGRSLIALSPLLTLLVNPPGVLFAPDVGIEPLQCTGLMGRIGLFCVVPSLDIARFVGAAILLVVVLGWRPRWLALPHAWVAISLHNAASVVEGGDQIAGNLALLLLPVALLDGRRWHWRTLGGTNDETRFNAGETGRMVANTTMVVIRLQVCVVYLLAAVGKLAVEEWLDGTAIYYWTSAPLFGPDGLRARALGAIVGTAPGTTALTWGTILLELALAFGLVATYRVRRGLFWAGLALHVGIALMFGLIAFGIAMTGALMLYLWSSEDPPRLAEHVARRIRRRSRHATPDRVTAPSTPEATTDGQPAENSSPSSGRGGSVAGPWLAGRTLPTLRHRPGSDGPAAPDAED